MKKNQKIVFEYVSEIVYLLEKNLATFKQNSSAYRDQKTFLKN